MKSPTRKDKIFSIIIFILSLGLAFGILLVPVDAEKVAPLGYGGIFVITLLGAMTLFIPGPTMVAAFVIGTRFNPLLVSLFAGLGSAFGETTGYAAGFATRALVADRGDKVTWYLRIMRWMMKYPFFTLFIFSAIPNPLTDVSGLIAGRMKYSYLKFLFATFLGKTIRFGMSAYLGAALGPSLFHH